MKLLFYLSYFCTLHCFDSQYCIYLFSLLDCFGTLHCVFLGQHCIYFINKFDVLFGLNIALIPLHLFHVFNLTIIHKQFDPLHTFEPAIALLAFPLCIPSVEVYHFHFLYFSPSTQVYHHVALPSHFIYVSHNLFINKL